MIEISATHTPVKGNAVVICSQYNSKVTEALLAGALATLRAAGVPEEQLILVRVPGAFELTTAAMVAAERKKTALVICLGAVIRGDTPHFDYICQAVARGLTRASQKTGKPVTFGVITANTPEQAFERAGGAVGNKGEEAATAALELYSVLTQWETQA